MKHLSILCAFLLLHFFVQAQDFRFNAKLDKFSRLAIQSFKTIPPERKLVLDETARKLTARRYVVFACKTNSRRTQLLQVWAQTAFYYYGLYDKHAFSAGDSVTPVPPGVARVLEHAGFYVHRLISADPNGYMISISNEYPQNVLSAKDDVGTIDTAAGLVINICSGGEQAGSIVEKSGIQLPYRSPVSAENTVREKNRYRVLNHQIAVEMLYLGARTRELALEQRRF